MAGKICAVVAVLAGVLIAPSTGSATTLPSTITENTTLTPAGNPYTGPSTIEPGVTLTIKPGVEITETRFTVNGTLDADGTAESPIVLKGNVNSAVTFHAGSGASRLDQVEINAPGGWFCCGNAQSSIKILGGASPTIENSTIRNAKYSGIWVKEGGSPTISANHFITSSSEGAAIYYEAGSGKTGTLDIKGNLIEGGSSGINVNTTGSSVSGGTLSGNTVLGTKGTGLYFTGPDIPGNVTENTLTGNKDNVIEIGGTVAQSSAWNDGGSLVRIAAGGGVTIASGVTLKIGPGVEIAETRFTVNGTLDAYGTAEAPIVFKGTTSSAVTFQAGSGSSRLDHVEINGSGAWVCCGNAQSSIRVLSGASPTIENSTIRNAKWAGIWVKEGGSPTISANLFVSNEGPAISYEAGSGKAGAIDIKGNLIEGGSSGISVSTIGSSVSPGTLSGNTVLGTKGIGLSISASDIPGNITENTLAGNANNVIEIGGTVAQSSTWNDGGSLVRIASGSGVTVASGVTLKIGAGVEIAETRFTVNGILDADGTAEAPIVLKGNVNTAVTFQAGSGASRLDHVEVTGSGGWFCCGNAQSSIKVLGGASPTIESSTIRNSKYAGIWVKEGGSPTISANLFVSNEGPAISYEAGSGKAGAIDIKGNLIEGGSSGISVSTTGSSVSGGTLSGNTVLGTKGTGLSVSAADIPGNITENTLIGNQNNVIEISGTVAHSSTWNDGGAQVRTGNGVTIASGVTLKIGPGVEITETRFTVNGTLDADGTAESPIVLKGTTSSAVTFQAGSGASRLDQVEINAPGGWFCCGNAQSSIKILGGVSPTIENSTIRNAKYAGIWVKEGGSPKIEWNRFRGNAAGIVYEGAGTLSTPNNDWGCASGPSPAGCGNSVTSNVKWKPAVQLPELAGHCRGQESQCGEGADPVSLATGHLSYSHRDLVLTNKSEVPLELTRAYSSGSSADTGLGPGWAQSGLASATELASGAVLILRQDGRQDLFVKTETGYIAPSGVTSTLAKVEGKFQLTTLENTVYRFDESGRIASITDDHGLKTTYGYNAEGRLATITDPSSQTLTFSYNGSNHITSVKDSTGREVKYTYSAAGDLATVTDALGGVTEYTYDSEHRLKTIKDPRGNVILKNTFDGQGRVIEQLDGLENLWKLEYKEGETIVTEPEGGKITYGFDSQDRVISENDQLSNVTTTSYDAAGNVDAIVKPGGAKWQFGHDVKGSLTSVIDPEGGERSYEYDGKNRLESFTDEREETWTYEWDEDNDLVKITDPAEGETTFTHDAAGLPLAVTDPNEHTTTFTYDTRGNRLTAKDALEHTTTFGYNNRNHLTSTTKPGLEPEIYGRNALGDLLSVTTPEGHKTEYAYDGNGMRTKVTDPAEGVWKIELNAMERPTAYVDPLGKETKVEYDGNLNPVKVIDRRGQETTYAYDLANQLTEMVRPEGGDWEYDYDARGNRIEAVEPRENATAYEFDLLDRMTEASEPLEVTTEYGYDAGSNLTSVTDPRGNTTSYGYDELGRLTEIDQPLEKSTVYTHDGVGNVLTRSTAAGTLEYEYDAADRLKEVTDGEATLRTFGYDNADRLTAATDEQGKKIEISYNEDDLVSAINDGRGQSLTRNYDPRGYLTKQVDGRGSLEYEYDQLGRLESLTDPQGKESTFAYNPEGGLTEVSRPGGIVTTNVYDDAGRLSETTTEAGEPAAVLEEFEYGYDPAGNVIKRIDSRLEQETTFAYNALNRLTKFNPPGEGSTTYGYDMAGNRTEAGGVTHAYNALNQLTSSSDGTTYGYDEAGRLIGKEKETEETTYKWDLFDHLASVESEGETASYSYDALGRLSERTSEADTQVAHYGDLTDLPSYDTNGGGETTTAYVRGPRALLSERSGEATSFPLADAHGDITAIANAAGEVVSRQSYDPWGVQLSGPSLEMGYLGAQQRRSYPGTRLIQMGVRSYGPALGRFLTEDRIFGHVGIGTSFDRYAYVWDNPLNLYDLDGRDVCVPTPFGDACAGDAAEDAGNAAGNAASAAGSAVEDTWNWTAPGRQWVGGRAQAFWKVTGDYVTSCLGNAAWGAVSGAAIGAGAAGAGAVPGAVGGGLSGCGAGLVQQGLEDAGQDTAAEVVDFGTAARDVGKAAKDIGKEAPELPERLKDVWDVFF